jgi:hypothetical protein
MVTSNEEKLGSRTLKAVDCKETFKLKKLVANYLKKAKDK